MAKKKEGWKCANCSKRNRTSARDCRRCGAGRYYGHGAEQSTETMTPLGSPRDGVSVHRRDDGGFAFSYAPSSDGEPQGGKPGSSSLEDTIEEARRYAIAQQLLGETLQDPNSTKD